MSSFHIVLEYREGSTIRLSLTAWQTNVTEEIGRPSVYFRIKHKVKVAQQGPTLKQKHKYLKNLSQKAYKPVV